MQVPWVFLKVFVILHYCIELVQCDCVIDMPKNRYNKPRYQTSFGTRQIQIPYTWKSFILKEGLNISGYCAETFSDFLYAHIYNNHHYNRFTLTSSELYKIELNCKNNKLVYLDEFELPQNTLLSCKNIKWQLFETVTPFSWCPVGMSSLMLARSSDNRSTILADICYDIERRSLHTLHYRPISQKEDYEHNELKESKNSKNIELGVEIFNIELLSEDYRIEQQDENHQKFWLSLAKYESDSINQVKGNIEHFKAYAPLLDIVWWPNLRLGNWQRFIDALDVKLNENHKYNLFVGTSGVVRVPQREPSKNGTEPLMLNNSNKSIPAYVWTLVQPTDDNEEFVFVGYNSPFYEYFNEKDIIFCKDICSEVPWLNKTRSTFRYATLGISFCCSVEEVRSLNILVGFPGKEKITTTEEPTTISYPQTTTMAPLTGNIDI